MSAVDEEKTFVMKHVFKNVSSYEVDPSERGNSIDLTRGKPHYGPEKNILEHNGSFEYSKESLAVCPSSFYHVGKMLVLIGKSIPK
ncbi:hypothetical protein L3Y34_000546 [Caenorhabditis briggsae]|uniref:Uncharacterized protein n=1 Tax=Caenorhabditis briggsae TaxID=6238 RepID=A0AAE9IN17_CAEBR|nr:hypothetical protein L3Y34_000546 [Caenorhabditis briggsae]